MTVSDLIDVLRSMPPGAHVSVAGPHGFSYPNAALVVSDRIRAQAWFGRLFGAGDVDNGLVVLYFDDKNGGIQ